MMGNNRFGMVLMVGGGGRGSDVEQALRHARQAAARDLIDQAQTLAQLGPLVVLSDDAEWLETLEGLDVRRELSQPGEPFHFGRTLAGLIERYRLRSCLYLGAGSAPLLSSTVFAQTVYTVLSDQPVLVTNNLYSSDWAAFCPADAIAPLTPWLERDNALAWVWQERAGYPVRTLRRTAATQLDIDTPFDLLVLARHPGAHPHMRDFLSQLDWPSGHLDAVLDVLRREASQVVVAGRVSSWIWRILEERTRAWVRVFAEERGMRASGRQARGEVRSLLNDYLDLVGVDQFFVHLAEIAEAVVLDSRVILASRGMWPSDADRFHADLFMAEQVGDPFLRRLSAAARSAPMPVVMGGHSLVSGGLAALLEGAGFVTFT